jgi:hypothetical protein
MMSAEPGSPVLVPGLTDPRVVSLERSPIRIRESSVTQSAWRLAVACDQGDGAITLVDAVPGTPLYRGDGVFLGWSGERLAAAYEALRPKPEEDRFETQQLG